MIALADCPTDRPDEPVCYGVVRGLAWVALASAVGYVLIRVGRTRDTL